MRDHCKRGKQIIGERGEGVTTKEEENGLVVVLEKDKNLYCMDIFIKNLFHVGHL